MRANFEKYVDQISQNVLTLLNIWKIQTRIKVIGQWKSKNRVALPNRVRCVWTFTQWNQGSLLDHRSCQWNHVQCYKREQDLDEIPPTLVERTNLPKVAVPPQFLHPYPTGILLKNTRECPERFVECPESGKNDRSEIMLVSLSYTMIFLLITNMISLWAFFPNSRAFTPFYNETAYRIFRASDAALIGLIRGRRSIGGGAL
jgi:hypothetical protein